MPLSGVPGQAQPGLAQPGAAAAHAALPPGTWGAVQSTTVSLDGNASIEWTTSATGNIEDSCATPPNQYVAATPGLFYTTEGSFQAGSVGRNCQVGIAFYDNTTTQIGTTVYGAPTLSVTGAWREVYVTQQAPVGAVWVGLFALIAGCGSGEVHYGDEFAIFQTTGALPAWSLGGFTGGAETVEVEYSDDLGGTWTDLIGASALTLTDNQAVVVDYWAPNGIARWYRARTQSTAYSQPVYSPWTTVIAAPLSSYFDGRSAMWMLDPQEPWLDQLGYGAIPLMRFRSMNAITSSGINVSLEIDQDEDQGVFTPVGQTVATVVRGPIRDEYPASLSMYFADDDSWQRFVTLRNRQRPILLKSDMAGETWYLALGASRPGDVLRTSDRSVQQRRSVTMSCVPVTPPEGLQPLGDTLVWGAGRWGP